MSGSTLEIGTGVGDFSLRLKEELQGDYVIDTLQIVCLRKCCHIKLITVPPDWKQWMKQ